MFYKIYRKPKGLWANVELCRTLMNVVKLEEFLHGLPPSRKWTIEAQGKLVLKKYTPVQFFLLLITLSALETRSELGPDIANHEMPIPGQGHTCRVPKCTHVLTNLINSSNTSCSWSSQTLGWDY